MKLLFLLDAVDYPTAVNPQLARRAAAVLAAQGHTVHLLQLWDGASPLPAPPGGCRQFALSFPDERRMNEALEHGNAAGAPVPVRLARLAGKPDAALAAVRMLALRRPRRRTACRREIVRLDAEYHYDAAIAVAAPYHAAFALAGAPFGGKKAGWLMDPYSQNREHGAPPPRMLAGETVLCRAMDVLFVTRLMAPDYAPGGAFAAFEQKAHVLEFPALVPAATPAHQGQPEGAPPLRQGSSPSKAGGPPKQGSQCTPFPSFAGAPSPLRLGSLPASPGPSLDTLAEASPRPTAQPSTAPARIRCVFVGNLYPELRTPEAALELFTALDDPAVSLHFYGGGWEHFGPDSPVAQVAARAKQLLGGRLSIEGPLPPDAARQRMAEADILLSLGNTVANQLPSKVFDYCGAGLPVLHLARRADDPALPYFARYPLACLIGPDELSAPGTLDRLREFLHSAAGKRLPFAEAQHLFWENTPEAVAARLLELLA